MEYAFQQKGNNKAASRVRHLGKHGTDLAKYLVNTHSWVGVYFNPDTNHPVDARDEHNFTYYKVNNKKSHCRYYGIPVSFTAVNYRPTPKTNSNFQKLVKKGLTKLNNIDIAKLANAKFGFGVMNGGNHTWLFSYGNVYEVHWSEIGSNLYEKTPLKKFHAKSGVIVFPPLVAAALTLTHTTCN